MMSGTVAYSHLVMGPDYSRAQSPGRRPRAVPLIAGGRGFIGRADGVVQDDRLVKILIEGRQVVVDDQDRGSRGSQPMKDGDNHLFGGHVHSRKGLVEQDEARLLRDRPSQEHALLLAAG